MVENDHDKKNNTGAVTVGNQIKTEAQRNIDNAIAHAPTGEDNGLAGMITTNTYSGENSAQAQQKKREKEAFQRVTDTALRESIRMQNDALNRIQEEIDKIDGELKTINKEQKSMRGMVDGLEAGASLKELEKDPIRKKFIDKLKKKNPDIGEAESKAAAILEYKRLSVVKEHKQERREKLEIGKEEIRDLPSGQDHSQFIKRKMGDLNLSIEDRLEVSAEVNNDLAKDSLVASGRTLKEAQDLMDDLGSDTSSNFEETPFSGTSVSSEISDSFQKEKITPTFKAAAENTGIPEFENTLEFNPELTVTPSAAI
jgi:hypothetical protein